MLIIFFFLLVVFLFEARYLIKQKQKKEAGLYIVLSLLALSLGAILMLVPEYPSFSKMVLDLFGAR